jgi:tRNA-specific 2-thiouridylase
MASNNASAHAEAALSGAHPRALAAMSGGVDSSVAAYLLTDQGFETEGVTLKLFENEDACLASSRVCCSLKDAEEARQVCLTLGIPHFVYNFTRTFNHDVIDRFCDGYLAGETPNPCIDCNRYVKFAALQQRRRELGYDYVATGHYARRAFDEKTGRYLLLRGRDANKDQSYVLFHLTQDTLAHMLFPLGELTKPEVRAIAARQGFINANKPESQDICFVPDGDYATFIGKRRGTAFPPGDIVDRAGHVLGRHRGLIHYTVGQRKGIGVAAREPLYVCAKDAERNRLVVGTDAETRCTGVVVRDVNLIALAELSGPVRCEVKTHYRQTARPAVVTPREDGGATIAFDEPQRACAPGQAAVFYQGDVVVGGGTIESVQGLGADC